MFSNGTVTDFCISCLRSLSDEEKHYYECRCEACERKEHDRLVAWRCGGEDAELDKLYCETGLEG